MATLEVQSGTLAGQSFTLPDNKPVTIGNRRSADIPLLDPGISWDHARIVFDKGKFWLQDLNATNGTYINGERVEKQRAKALDSGDLILFAGTVKAKFAL